MYERTREVKGMRRFFLVLTEICLIAAFFVPRIVELSFSASILMFSFLPPLACLCGILRNRVVLQEVKQQKFRLAVYGLSIILFILCLLSYFGVFSFTQIEGGLTLGKKWINYTLATAIAFLTLFNLVIMIRDTNKRDRGVRL